MSIAFRVFFRRPFQQRRCFVGRAALDHVVEQGVQDAADFLRRHAERSDVAAVYGQRAQRTAFTPVQQGVQQGGVRVQPAEQQARFPLALRCQQLF